jgi:hypothetical protein
MGVAFTGTGSNYTKITTGASSATAASGTWAISWWMRLPAANAINTAGNAVAISRLTVGPSDGFNIWVNNQAQSSGNRMYWEAYNSGSSTLNGFNSATLDGIYNSGWHHFMMCKASSGNVALYLDGAHVQTVAGTDNWGGSTSKALSIGYDPAAYGTSRSLTGAISDLVFFSSITWDLATLAKIMYESRGRDHITEGVIARWKLDDTTEGTTVTAASDIGPSGVNFTTVTNSPTFEAAPIN